MRHLAHLLGRSLSNRINNDKDYAAIRKLRNNERPTKKNLAKPAGYDVKDIPTYTTIHQLADLTQLFDLWKTDRATKAHNDESAFVPTDRKRIVQILYTAGYELVMHLYDPVEVSSSYWEKRKDKESTPRQQIQFLFLKKETVPDHPHLRYAVYIKDCWDGKTAFTLSCAILHDTHFQTRNPRQIVWKEYMRLSHREPHVPGEIYDQIHKSITHFETMWDIIGKRVQKRTLVGGSTWDEVMEEALELRTDASPNNPLHHLKRYGYTHYDALGNLYTLWSFASGSFRIGKIKEKKYTPTPTKEALIAFDKNFNEEIVHKYFP